MLSRALIPLATLLALAGCAEIQTASRDYVEPTSGETAKVRFSTNGSLILIPERNCKDFRAPGAGVVVSDQNFVVGKPALNGRKIGIRGTAPAGYTSAEVVVTAGKPIVAIFDNYETRGGWNHSCSHSVVFVPKAGEEYQMTVKHDIAAGFCGFEGTSLINTTQRVSYYKTQECK